MSDYTDAEKLEEVKREITMRKRVYPGLIAKGGLSHAQAKRRLALMEAIAEDYRLQGEKRLI